jgi:hypothetical protein
VTFVHESSIFERPSTANNSAKKRDRALQELHKDAACGTLQIKMLDTKLAYAVLELKLLQGEDLGWSVFSSTRLDCEGSAGGEDSA